MVAVLLLAVWLGLATLSCSNSPAYLLALSLVASFLLFASAWNMLQDERHLQPLSPRSTDPTGVGVHMQDRGRPDGPGRPMPSRGATCPRRRGRRDDHHFFRARLHLGVQRRHRVARDDVTARLAAQALQLGNAAAHSCLGLGGSPLGVTLYGSEGFAQLQQAQVVEDVDEHVAPHGRGHEDAHRRPVGIVQGDQPLRVRE